MSKNMTRLTLTAAFLVGAACAPALAATTGAAAHVASPRAAAPVQTEAKSVAATPKGESLTMWEAARDTDGGLFAQESCNHTGADYIVLCRKHVTK